MNGVTWISPEEARNKIEIGQALLVCAYEDDEKCKKINLEYGIIYSEFLKLKPDLSRDREIFFYCT